MGLTKKERLFLYNQYEILKLLNLNDDYQEKRYEQLQAIVAEGYEFEYHQLLDIFEDEMPKEESKFVLDVLQMYRVLNNSYIKLKDDEKSEIGSYDITFKGFDGNVDSRELSYLTFVFDECKRYAEIFRNMDELNSHHDYRDMYKEMLSRWESLETGRYAELTLNQMKSVIGK